MKKTKTNRKVKNVFRLSAAIVAIVLAAVMVIGLIPNEAVLAADYLADLNTSTKYTESLGDNASTEYAGRVWTDKTVYAGDATFTGYSGASQTVLKGEDDFLISFSALATSQSISGQTQAPVDVVLIIDISGSMSNEDSNMDNGKSRIYNTIQATNNAIDELMALNPYTRVAVVAFSSNAQVLLPLDRYTKATTIEREWVGGWNGHWEETEVEVPYFSLSRETASSNNATLYTNAVNSVNRTIERETSVSGGTNIQLGLYEGMQVLATEEETTVTINGNQIQRVPSVVLLSDGSPTYSSDDEDWWAPDDNYNDGPGSKPYAGNGMKAILVGSYMKDAIDRNYEVTDTPLATTVYTIGMGITGLDEDEKNLAYMTLDPGTYWDDEDVTNSMKTTIKQYWADYTEDNNSGTLNINVGKYENRDYKNKYYELTHPDTGYDVDPKTGYNYVDDYYDADNANAVAEVFKQIVADIAISTPQIPTEHDPANPALSGYITYTDPIGEYMEVKNMKSIIYAGVQYEFDEKGNEGTVQTVSNADGTTITTYKFKQVAQGNDVYGTEELEHIIIEVVSTTDAKGVKSQVLTIKIPASLIPLRVNTISLREDGTVESHTNNGTYPIRVLYTVGLQEEVLSNGNVDLNKISAEYKAKNLNDDGTIDFYSNLYTGNKVNGITVGNATASFDAAATNPFYYMQEDTVIYKDSAFTEKATEILDEETYYYKETYYHGTQVVTKATERTGAQLKQNTTVTKHERDGYYYRPAGTVRVNNMLTFEGEKIANATNTAADFYTPTYDGTTGQFVVYLGNNGVMSVEAAGSLEITKVVEEADGLTAPDKDFTFTVDLDGIQGTYPYIVTDAAGNGVAEGTIVNGGTLTLKDGQTATILNLPPGTQYTVTEAAMAGFATSTVGANGEIVAGQVVSARFTNTYSVEEITFDTNNVINGKKVLVGRDWAEGDSFTFFLTSTNNAPLPEGYDAAAGVTVGYGEDAKDNEVSFNFGSIKYTAPGLYRYTIVEKEPENNEYKPGMTYSRALYSLAVYVVDNGDGTLSSTSNIQKLHADDATPLYTMDANNQIVMNPGQEAQDDAVFTNTYNAESVTSTPVAIKKYTDNSGLKPLVPGMFQFKLTPVGIVDENGNVSNPSANPMPLNANGEKLTEAVASNEGENVTFPSVTFTQADVLNGDATTYRYQMEEIIPSNATAENGYKVNGMAYDANKYYIDVTVSINPESDEVTVNAVYPNEERIVSFRNVYTPEEVVLGKDTLAPIKGTKTLTGRDMLEGESFKFTLTYANDVTKQAIEAGTIILAKNEAEVSNGKDGIAIAFDFGTTTFTKPGTYVFNVVETKGENADKGVTYDSNVCKVTVVVTDNNGKLEASVSYANTIGSDNTQAVFNNTYEATFDADTAINLGGKKTLTGRDIKEGEFYFAVKLPNGTINYVPATLDGTIKFLENITYTVADTYTYEISEVIPTNSEGNVIDNGVTFDTSVYTVTVTVTDDLAGTLSAAITEIKKDGVAVALDTEIEFNNTYAPDDVVYDFLPLQKVLSGERKDALKAGEFTFVRTAEPKDGIVFLTFEGKEVGVSGEDRVANAADGTVAFGDIKFTEAGTYVVTIKEDIPDDANKVAGVTYDTHELKAIFEVKDNLDGKLVVSIKEVRGSQIFTNEYKTTGTLSGDTYLNVTKILDVTKRTPKNTWQESDIFTFVLEATDEVTKQAIADGKVVLPENADGLIIGKPADGGNTNTNAFGDIVFHMPGEYAFMIREVEGNEPGMDYDVTFRSIKVVATDEGDGTLSITLSEDSQTNLKFKNVYNVDDVVLSGHDHLHVNKVFTGRPNNEWADGDSFTFTLEAIDKTITEGQDPLVELGETQVTITKDNKGVAHFGNITFNAAGTYEFMIKEAAGTIAGVTYDTNMWKVIVIVDTETDKDNKELHYLVVNAVDYKKLNASGEEIAIATDESNLTFTNTYTTEEVTTTEEGIVIDVTKALSGRDWKDTDAFKFLLAAGNDETADALEAGKIVFANATASMAVEINGTDAEKKAEFGEITFKEPGTYTFVVSEDVPDDKIPGISYDRQVDIIRIEVIDNGEGKLDITKCDITGDMVWTNTFTPDVIEVTLSGIKTIDGRDMTENDIFRFHIAALNEAAGSAMPAQTEVTNAVPAENKATITFGPITYTKAGVYEYAISERPVSVAGITNDTGYVKAVVEVIYDAVKGVLVAKDPVYTKVNADGEGFVFINKYTAEGFLDGSTHLKVTKHFTGRVNNAWIEGDAFTFQLAANLADEATKNAMEAQIITLPENATGITIAYADALKEKAFGSIKFIKAGTYQFVITEVVPAGENNGITYDTDLDRIITVVVTDNGDGTLTATVKEGSESLTFNNSYDTKETVLSGATYLAVEKQIVGREWITNDTYSFTLEANMDHPLTKDALEAQEPTIIMPNDLSVTITNDTEGHKAAFGNITFKEPGTYKFMIKENIPTEGKISGITYDNRTKYITVVVIDNNDGTMTATATVDNHQNLVFVNTYTAVSTDVVTFTGLKVMDGRALKDTDDFEFTITAVDGGPLPAETTVVNANDGTITFAPIRFEKAGTYKYEIKETGGSAPGVTNARNTVEVTVTVTDNYVTGKLEAEVSYSEGGFKFTNTYEATGVDVVVKGDKTVTSTPGNNYTMAGGEFKFEIVPSTLNPTEDPINQATEVTNTASGEITFIDANYTVSGDYIYTVHEKDGNVAGITEDNAVYTITVKISDSTDGYLVKEVSITIEDKNVDTVVFDNKYNPKEATAIFSGKKVLDSIHKTELADKLFTFKLVGKDNAPMPESDEATNDTAGFFQFGTITYTKPGTYEYTITEVDGNVKGYIYDAKTYDVTVTVTDENGVLEANVVGITDAEGNPVVVFTNDYVPDSVKLEGDTALKGNKKLTGRDLTAGEFEFVLSAEEGTPMPENEAVFNDKDGDFTFGTIEFSKAGTYYYIISETDNNLAGVGYDETSYTVKVEVTDKGGYLDAEVTYLVDEDAKDNVTFENTYEADPIINYSIWAKKTLSGRDLNEKEFTFKLEGEGISQTKYNDADGMVEFVIPEYDKAGDYVYTITEVAGDKGGVTYDASVYEVTVTVTDNTVEGKLEAEITKVEKTVDGETTEAEAVEFTNAYDAADTSIILTGKKNLTGRDLAAGEFTFLLKNEAGEVIAKATNKADGTITFEKLDFTQTGTFKYTIVEDASAKAANIKYDDTVYEVVIEVTDNLEGKLVAKVVSQDEIIFNNLYEAIEVPETGDSSTIAMWLALALISITGCMGVVLRRTRR